jgi:hypothetical protein
VGEILTATLDSADPDGDPPAGYSYQWQSSSDGLSWAGITGATTQTYALTADEEGKQVRVVVSYVDGQGFSESITTASVGVGLVDDGTAVFSITSDGTPAVGETLTASLTSADPDGDPPAGYSYQWQSSNDGSTWTAITGANNSTYALSADEEGKLVRVLVAYIDGQGFSEAITTASVGVGLIDDGDAGFSISGIPAVGEILTATLDSADPDGDPPAGYSYQWQFSDDCGSSWNDITGATNQIYALTPAEEGKQVRVLVSHIDGQGFSEAITTASVGVGLVDDGDAVFSITSDGSPAVGETLTATLVTPDPDGDPPAGYSYQWQSSGNGSTWSDITGATGSTYALTAAEEGKQVRVLVSYIDGQGFSEAITTASVGVGLIDDGDAGFSISGTPAVGEILSATLDSADPDGDPPAGYTYQWQSSSDGSIWAAITGATASTLALTPAEEGRQVRVVVSYIDGQGFSESITTASVGMGLIDDGNALFSISGTPVVGQTLTATLTSSDPDGDPVAGYAYQWQSSSNPFSEISSGWSDISSATGSTYVLTAAEEGQYVRVVVRYIDGQGFSESITTPSVGVGLIDDGNTVFSIFSDGTPAVGETLSAILVTPDPDGNPPAGYSYQWQSSGNGSTWADITEATASTFALTPAEEGKQVRVVVSYVDGQGFSESVSTTSVGVGLIDDGNAVFSIAGTPAVGQTLTASLTAPDPDGAPPAGYTYQWQSSSDGSIWAAITGATASTYALTPAEEGKQVRVVVSYVDKQDFTETVDTNAVEVQDITPPDPGTLSFSGLTDTGSADMPPITQDTDFSLVLSGNEPGSTVVYELSTDRGRTWSPTSSSQSSLAEGSYLFRARVADPAGNSATSNSLDVAIDTTAPAAPSIDSFADDTDPVGDGITADNTLILSGSAEAGSSVSVTDGTTSFGPVIANPSTGAWSLTTFALADGSYAFTASATDAAGNSSATSNTLSVTVQTAGLTPPSDGADVITGTEEGEVISGVPADSTINGVGSIDILTGLGGPDLFLLGNGNSRYYDGGDLSDPGDNDFAYITDFKLGDRIQLFGSPEDYVLGKGRFDKNSPKATIIYYRNPERPGNASSSRPWRNDEWIGMVVSDETLDLTNLNRFQYVSSLG